MATPAAVGEVPAGAHVVQFYETDDFLVDVLWRFVHRGLEAGEACVVIATRAHRARLRRRLQADGLDATYGRRNSPYQALDADKLLSTFLVDGMPDPGRFSSAITRIIERMTQDGRQVRLFGEMVARLWQAGNQPAALRLESLWNELHRRATPSFTLLCAYPIQVLAGFGQQSAFAAISQQHAHVMPDEPLSTLEGHGGQPHRITRLQREAHALQVEIARRQLLEEQMRFSELRYRRLFEGSLDGVLMVDPKTERINDVNSAALDALCAVRDNVVGQELWQVGLFHDRNAAHEFVRELGERSVIRYDALPLGGAAGTQREVEFVGSLITLYGTDGPAIIQCTIRDVSERRRLEREVTQRTNELEAIQKVTDAMLAHMSLDSLLPELLDRVRGALTVDNVAILLPDSTGYELRIHMARGPEEEVAGQVRVPIGQGVAGRIAATRQPLIIDDLRTAKVANPFLRERLRSLMGVPLLVEDRLIGVIHAATVQEHHFTPAEVRLLRLVADRIALAIERVQMYQQAQHARREALERANQLYATIESMSDGVIVFGRDGQLLQMNATAQRMLGYDLQLDGATAWKAFSQLGVRDARGQPLTMQERPANRILRGEIITGAQAEDLTISAADGGVIQVSVAGAPVRDEMGGVLGAVCVFRDVSEQRRLERRTHEALTALLAMAGALVELPEILVEAEPDARESIAAASPELAVSLPASSVAQHLALLARDVLGCQRVSITAIKSGTLMQEPVAVVGLSLDEERKWWQEQRAQTPRYGEGTAPELRARFEAGEALVLDMTQPPYNARPNPYAVSTVLMAPLRVGSQLIGILALDFGGPPHRFTTEERALAGAVAQLVAMVIERDRLLHEREEAYATALAAQETTRRMHTFLGIAGHELRSPVTAIKASVQLSERALAALMTLSLSAETYHSLQRAQSLLARADQQADRLRRLIEDVLDVTRTQAGRLSLRAEFGELGAVVHQAVEAERASWPQRDITLALPETPVYLMLDADRVEQVVVNFLTNALKYSADDTPVAVQVTTALQTARVAVRDHGPGLSREMQRHLWEPFHQVEGIQQQSGSGVGLGLGLHICRSLIERHGGRVGVESVVGEGSTFWFELPLVASESNSLDPGANS